MSDVLPCDCELLRRRLHVAFAEPAAMLRALDEERKALSLVQTAPYLPDRVREYLCDRAFDEAFNRHAVKTFDKAVDLMVANAKEVA